MSGTIVFDTETTGLDPNAGDRIVQLAAVKIDDDGREVDHFVSYVNPNDRRSTWDSWVVHKIDFELLKDAPPFAHVYEEFRTFCGDLTVISAHNLPFDLSFFDAECERAALENFLNAVCHEDTLEMTRKTWPGKPASLDALAKHVGASGVDRGDHHDALEDVRLLVKCIPRLRALFLERAENSQEQSSENSHSIPDTPVTESEICRASSAPMLFYRSGYSVGQSIFTPDKIIAANKPLSPSTVIGLCDNNLAGAYEFFKKASSAKIKVIVGQTLTAEDLEFSLFVTDASGWSNLSTAASHLALTGAMPDAIDITGLQTCLSASSPRVRRWLAGEDDSFIVSLNPAWLSISRAPGSDLLREAIDLAASRNLSCVAAPIIVAPKGADLAAVKALGGEPHPLGIIQLTPDNLARLYADIPEAFDNAIRLAELCNFSLHEEKSRLPRYTGAIDENQNLADLAFIGLNRRLEIIPDADRDVYFSRLDYETGMIQRLGFSGYFLIVADFVREARDRDIPVGPGRGSGAGSIVAWALGITNIDPIYFGLFFERFINPDRVSPPDFDIDFCEKRRNEVIAYVAETYGTDRVAQIGTWMTLAPKGAFKAAARTGSIEARDADRFTKIFPEDVATIDDALAGSTRLQAEANADPALSRAFDIARQLEGAIYASSRHAAGVIIADAPLAPQTPLSPNPGSPGGVPATQFNMKSVEAQGLIKFDFLVLATLTIIKRATDLLKEHGEILDPWLQPYDDAATYQMINNGWNRNVFQLGQDGMGKKAIQVIHPTNIEDLIAMISLYRPGPMDQIPVYARRKQGVEAIEYPHPALKELLASTYGIPIYQEQIMSMGRLLAGYTLGQADLLRRAMGKKIPAEMAKLKVGFIQGCIDNAQLNPRMTEAQAENIFHMIEKFAGYGFNRSHAAAYALISYATAWMKRHRTEAFIAGCLDQEANNVIKLQQTVNETRKLGCKIRSVDINMSRQLFSLEKTETGFAIRYAISALASVGENPAGEIENERKANGLFVSVEDFRDRMNGRVSKGIMTKLAEAGAFDSLIPGAKEQSRAEALHHLSAKANQIDILGAAIDPLTTGDMIARENKAYGFALSAHPVHAWLHLINKKDILPLDEAIKARKAMNCWTIAEIYNVKQEGAKVIAVASDGVTSTRIEFALNVMPPLRKSQKSAVAKLHFAEIEEKYKNRKPGAPLIIGIEILN